MTNISMIRQRQERRGLTLITLLLAAATVGCGNGWMSRTDPNAAVVVVQEPIVSISLTPEVRDVRHGGDVAVQRGWDESSASYHSGDVEHLALYLQDPFERRGSNDGYFQTWCLDDVVAAFNGPTIFFGQTVGLPVAAVVAPPWQEACSDGNVAGTEPVYVLPAIGSGVTSNEDYE